MNTILEVQVKSVYGQERIYPINDQAKKIAKLLNRKTLTSEDLGVLKSIGFEIKWVAITLS